MAFFAMSLAGDPARFHEEVLPVFVRHCTECHQKSGPAPFPLTDFQEVRKRFTEIEEVLATGRMPPWLPAPQEDAFRGERRLSAAEQALLRAWKEQGFPEGDPSRAVAVPERKDGWTLGTPDLVVQMDVPYTVPASGRDVYRHFVLPLRLTNSVHVAAWELRPGSRTVHHAFLKVDSNGEARRQDARDPDPGFPGMDSPAGIQPPAGHFASWQPGAAPVRNPPGLPWVLEAGTDLVLQAHLQPSGKPETLRMAVGLWLSSTPPTNQPVKVGLVQYGFVIPPGSTNTWAAETFPIDGDCEVLGILPHSHYLARTIEAEAEMPDGRKRSLLRIPDWDFNWQGAYHYEKPVFLPAGTRIHYRVRFDNSRSNPRNPFDPPKETRFGLNTTDEMAELWIQLLPRDPRSAERLRNAVFRQTTRDVVAYNKERLRIDPKDPAAFLNLGRVLLARQQATNAFRMLSQAVALDPGSAEAHYSLGLTLRILSARDEARHEFQEAARLDPKMGRAWGNLGFLEVESGDTTAGIESFKKAIELNPKDTVSQAALGSILSQLGRHAEALPFLRAAAVADPNDLESRRLLEAAKSATNP